MAATAPPSQLAGGGKGASFGRLASKTKGSELTEEHVLASLGTKQEEAVMAAALPSAGFISVAPLPRLLNLRDLDLSGNQLQEVSCLASLPALRRLNLAGNCLASLAPSLAPPGSFAALEQLDLSYNRLDSQSLQLLAILPRLQELDVSGNGLQALPALHPASVYPALRKLAGGHNQLTGTALAALALLPLLQHLVLPDNNISSIPALGPPSAAFARLVMLDLQHNSISELAAVQRLQGLPSIERLLVAGNPVAGAGFGASGSIAGTLHRTHAGARRGSPTPAAGSSRPSMAHSFQHMSIEEPSAVSMRAKALATRRRSSSATSTKSGSSGDASCAATRPGSSASLGVVAEDEAVAAVPAIQAAAAASAGQNQPEANPEAIAGVRGAARSDAAKVAVASCIDWESDGEVGEWGAVQWEYGSTAGAGEGSQLMHWSNQSADGSHSTSGSTVYGLAGIDDPTVRVALGLGLDPLRLPLSGGPGSRASNPAAAIKALRYALAHPAAAPSMEGLVAAGSHLKMTTSVLAKQRQKAGAAGGQAGSLVDRVQTIDALLLAMKRRLKAVQAAMAADLVLANERQRQEEEAGGGAASTEEGTSAANRLQQAAAGATAPGSTRGIASGSAGRHAEQRASALFNMQVFADALGLEHRA